MAASKRKPPKSKAKKKTTADQPIVYIIPRKNSDYRVFVHGHYRRAGR